MKGHKRSWTVIKSDDQVMKVGWKLLRRYETKWSVIKNVSCILVIPCISTDQGWHLCGSIRISSSPSSTSSSRCRHGMLWDAISRAVPSVPSDVSVDLSWLSWPLCGFHMVFMWFSCWFSCVLARIWSSKKRSRLWLQRPPCVSMCRHVAWRVA